MNLTYKKDNELNNLPYEIEKNINCNIMQPYSFHSTLLKNENINFSYNQLRHYIFKKKNLTYRSDEIFLENVENYHARLTEGKTEVSFPFCQGYNQISRLKTKGKRKMDNNLNMIWDSFFLFSLHFLLNILSI